MRLVIGVLVVLIGVVALISVFWEFNTAGSTATFDGVTVLDLDLSKAAVVIEGVEGDQVVVEKNVTTGWPGGSNREEQDSGTLRLIQRCRALLGLGCEGTYTVTVPIGTEVRGRTANGAILISAVAGAVDVSTSNGEVELEELSAEIAVRTSNGPIEGRGLTSPSAEVVTSNGRVELDFDSAPDSVTVRTSNGSVEVVLPSDAPPYAVDASTSNGQVDTDIRTDPSAEASIDVSTSNGNVAVRYR